MKVVLIGVSHGHFRFCLDAIKRLELDIRGVSDKDIGKAKDVASNFGCPYFGSFDQLIQGVEFDFAFVWGRHLDMPAVGEELIMRGIPFSMEKPSGRNASDVQRLRELAEKRNLFVSIPFVWRYSELYERIKEYETKIPSDFNHLCFRFIAGPPSRYVKAGYEWILDKQVSGGGCAIILAVHFIDFFLFLTGESVQTVYAKMSNRTYGRDVEDYSTIVLTTKNGVTGVIETGWTFPQTNEEKREFYFSLRSRKNYYRSIPDGFRVISETQGNTTTNDIKVSLDSDTLYPIYIEHTIRDFKSHKSPLANLSNMEDVMKIIDAAYASADGGSPVTLS